MKSRIPLIFVFLAILGFIFFLVTNKNSEPKSETSESISTEQTISGKKVNTNSKYHLFTPKTLEKLKNTRRVLFFYANWCPTCRPADESFRVNESRIPDGVSLIRVNYNDPETDSDEKALARKYGITYQHTYVLIDSAGEVIKKWNGGQIEELLSNID